ncbi:5'-nucleotidase [Erythrobacter sp. SG61-1L]|uniref:bifunctional metallophosphatase/5'-nucleotidase n=1 Tax=Erythrobacter sp. SG61-1L TaxID=1603897 RepID=UPI0006C9272A|nr:bifunctional metallophosphatase/5'-nucleotidase [Erythrobacter sp. SG61-1L]KPL69364.1 5'-nucleotidase [Erythrobacter sp. SG61-1L]
MKRSTLRAIVAPAVLALALSGCAANYDHGTFTLRQKAPEAAPSGTVTVGIVAINDFHGALEPPNQSVQVDDGKGGVTLVPAGGAAWLASAVDSIRAEYPNNAVVSAGDLISASQLASSLFLDEPAIGVMNRIGLDFNAVGNHEFDSGEQELLRKQAGGCAKFTSREPCQVEQFAGASFRFLSASTFTKDGETLFPATGIKSFGNGKAKVSVGFIGLTLKDTPSLVSPDGVAGLTFGDEAKAINAAIPELKSEGADAIVVLIHQGGRTEGPPNPNGCEALSGEILPILSRLDPRVDVVVSGHTHSSYVCDYGTIDPSRPFLLTSAGVYGELVTDITLQIDPAADRVMTKRARNVIVQSRPYVSSRGEIANSPLFAQFQPRPDIAAYVKLYTDRAAQFSLRPVGALDGAALKGEGPDGGTAGNLIADAQLAATRKAGAQIAFMNPFGVRATLNPAPDGSLTFGDLYKTQPFANTLVTQTMTGAEIKAVLEQGFDDNAPEQHLSPSTGFTYWYDKSRPIGDRVVRIELDGKPLDMSASYRVTTNSFLAGGGDSFTLLAAQRDAIIGMSDIDALEIWVKGPPKRAVPQEQREVDAAQKAVIQ